MRVRSALSLAPLALALTGCISAKDLNDQLQAYEMAETAAVRADPCPDKPSPLGAAAGVRLSSFDTTAALDVRALDLPAGASDLERGRQIILASGAAEVVDARAKIASLLDMDLDQFIGQMDEVDHQGADLADQALAAPGLSQFSAAPKARPAGDDQKKRWGKGQSASEASEAVWISRAELQTATRLVNQTTARNGWTAAFTEALGNYTDPAKSPTPEARAAKLAELQEKYLVAAYMTAYFRNGEIFSLNLDQAAITSALKEKLKAAFKDEEARKAAEVELDRFLAQYEKAICKPDTAAEACRLVGVIGEQTFVTRAGASHSFSGLTVTLDVTKDNVLSANKLDPDVIAPDLVRVLIEALGDERSKVPGVKTSTLCAKRSARCATADEADKIQKVNDAGDRVEAGTAAAVGAAIRGGWLFSLNNETVASTLTTAAAVTLRKYAEAATWKSASRSCPTLTDAPAFQTVAFRLTP